MITTQERLDTSAAAWLAERDPALVHLPEAIAGTHPRWSLHDAQWTPGQGCRMAYRVEGAYPGSASFVAINVDPTGWTQHDFRDDPDLPGLAGATDPALLTDELGRLAGRRVRHCRVQPVRYRPGARCVLQYDVTTTSGAARYYAKVFPGPIFADAASRAAQIAAAAPPALHANRVLAVWPARHTIVGAAVPGRSASAVLRDASVPAARRVDLAYGLGALLAGFHALRGVSAPVHTARDQVQAVAALLPAVDLVDAALGDRLRRLVGRLDRQRPVAEGGGVLIHGGFRPGQVIVDDTGDLHLLDLDGVARGNAGQDLASCLGHVSWLAIREPSQREGCSRIGQALLAGYQSGGKAVDQFSLGWWQAAALAQIAARRFRRLEVADWARVAPLIDLAETLIHDRSANEA